MTKKTKIKLSQERFSDQFPEISNGSHHTISPSHRNCDEANELLPNAVHFNNSIQDSVGQSLFDTGANRIKYSTN